MKNLLIRVFVFLFTAALLVPYSVIGAPKNNEMRAVWISTVYNLDFPSVKNNIESQKQEFINKLDQLQMVGINTVIVQVRPKGDALYSSAINPWSDVLTGTQGKDPGYDPMAFMIEETHKRGMEFHAWLNPYRVTTTGTDVTLLSENHPARLHTDWILNYNNGLYYNPEVMGVKQHIQDTVKEIVSNYNVDGIHFDDYFYPSNYPLPEGESKDGTVANSRRAHINEMVSMVNGAIKEIKPEVVFGISPQGIWKNSATDVTGSKTNGSECYYAVFADVRHWIQNGLIDYVAPQIYWETGHNAADYETLVNWWSNEVNGTNVTLYIGQGIYKDAVAEQIDTQLFINKKYSQVKGSIFFSCKELLSNRKDCKLKITEFYKNSNANNLPVIGSDGSDNTAENKNTDEMINETPKKLPPSNAIPSEPVQAVVSPSKIIIDGKEQSFEVYNINDNNYFKLRDVAQAITKTQKQFNVSWDELAQAIHILPNESYETTGEELILGDGKNKTAIESGVKLLLDGKEIPVMAYNINGNNYYKLRDLAWALDFGVTWQKENSLVGVDTESAYVYE